MPSKLEPAGQDFLTTAPSRYSETFAIARPAEELWRRLTSDDPLDWCRVSRFAGPRGAPLALGQPGRRWCSVEP